MANRGEDTLAIFRCVRAIQAVDELQKQSVENGRDKMDLEEVNREIQSVRKSGISTSKVADIWRRMSEKDGDSAIYSLTHPSYSERYLSLLSVDREIQEKRRAGLPIRPNKGQKNDSFIKLRPNVIKK